MGSVETGILAALAGFACGLICCLLAEASCTCPSSAAAKLPRASRFSDASAVYGIAFGVVGSIAFWRIIAIYGLSLTAIQFGLFCVVLLFLARTDILRQVIPNGCIVAALAIRIGYLVLAISLGWSSLSVLVDSLIGLAVLGGTTLALGSIADRIGGRASIGGGDIKLFAVVGAYFGWEEGLLVTLGACLLALVATTLIGKKRTDPFPFGPAIAAACLLALSL